MNINYPDEYFDKQMLLPRSNTKPFKSSVARSIIQVISLNHRFDLPGRNVLLATEHIHGTILT